MFINFTQESETMLSRVAWLPKLLSTTRYDTPEYWFYMLS